MIKLDKPRCGGVTLTCSRQKLDSPETAPGSDAK